MLLVIVKVKKWLKRFTKKKLQNINQNKIWMEKVIKGKSDKLYVKWKGYDNSFNNWIDKKRYCYIKISYFPPYSHSKNKIKSD